MSASVIDIVTRQAQKDIGTGSFDDAEVTHVEGDVDPCRDMAIIQEELRLKDAEWTEKHLACTLVSFFADGLPDRFGIFSFEENVQRDRDGKPS